MNFVSPTRISLGIAPPALLAATLIAGCAAPPCANEVLSGLPSPDGKHIAFLFHRQCDRAARPSTHVSVLGLHEPLHSGPGNVLIVEDLPPVKVAWLGPTTLSISNVQGTVTFKTSRLDPVSIEFH